MEEIRLSDRGTEEFAEVIERCKAKLKKANEEALSEIYCKLEQHIETDAWMNYRTAMRQELAYANGCLESVDGALWAANVRQKILEEHKSELISLLNQDHLAQIARLKDEISQIYKHRNY